MDETPHCSICQQPRTRHLPLYYCGSEGIHLCHECEMHVITYIRSLHNIAITSRKQGYLAAKTVREAKEKI